MFVVLIFFCFALGLKFEEIDGIFIYIHMRQRKAWMRERNSGMKGMRVVQVGKRERERERERGGGLRKK